MFDYRTIVRYSDILRTLAGEPVAGKAEG